MFPGESLLAAGVGYFGQQQTNQMQAQMMQQQQGFQERMSNTAYQRASADMTAAGLNPMMMFSSGSAASTPPGASPSPNVKSGLDADAVQKAVSTGVQVKVANATIDNLVEQNAKIKAETLTEGQRPALVSASTSTEREKPSLVRAETHLTKERAAEKTLGDIPLKQWQIPIVRNRAVTSQNEEKINNTARRLFDQGSYLGRKGSDTLAPVSDILSSAASARRAFRHYDWP